MSKFKMSGPSLYPNLRRSASGYRKGSNAVNDDSLVVPSNKISMCEDDGSPLEKGDIKGTGLTTGNTMVMKPGKSYEFKGDKEVLETPMAQTEDFKPHNMYDREKADTYKEHLALKEKGYKHSPYKEKDCTCWKGHSRVPGTKACAPGSCKKNK